MLTSKALRIGSTYVIFTSSFAFGYAIVLNTFGSCWTIVVSLTLDRSVTALFVGIADSTQRTQTLVGASRVVTVGSLAARRFHAEVDQVTADVRIACVAGLTRTNLFVILSRTKCIGTARISRQT